MIFKNSVSIFLSNISLIYKLLIFMMIVLIIAVALFIGIIGPVLGNIFSTSDLTTFMQTDDLDNLDKITFKDLFGSLIQDLRGVFDLNKTVIYSTLAWMGLVYLLARFFFTLSHVPIAKVIYDKMSSNFNNGFLAAFIQYSRQAFGYALFSSLISVPLDLLVTLGVVMLGIKLSSVVNIFAIAFSITIIMLYSALRSSLFNQWIPFIIAENLGTVQAFKKCITSSLTSLKDIFASTLIVYVLVIWATGGGLNLITFGIVPIFIVPFAMVFLNIMYMVKYFNNNNKKYYVDQTRIEDPANYLNK